MDNDREVLARTLMAEAGNQGPLGMLAAGSVIMNRARTPGYGDGVRGVIMKPGQFSPWNSVTGYAGGEQGQNMAAIQPTSEAYAIADRLLSGQYEDPTGGATHFYNPDISTPSWGQAAGGDWTRIGSHIFGQAGAGRSSTGDTDMVRGGAGQTSMMGQAGADFLASEQEQPRGLLGGFFGPEGRDRRARLAIALEGMTLNPNQALIGELQRGLEQRETAAQRNATVEFLRSRGRSDLADAIQGGLPAADALRIAMTPAEAQKGVVMGDRLVDPRTGQVIADFSGQAPAFKPEDISAARKEFTGLAPVKSFAEQTAAYGRIIASVEDPSPAGDLALIFNYMKVLDPGSTVREGEFATAEQAGGVDQRVRGLYNRVVSGERLTPEQRADFASRATRLYENAEQQYRALANQYGSFARAAGLPVEQVIPDFGYSGSLYQTPLEFQVPPPPAGIDPTQWRQAWQNMTDDERRQFLQGQR